MHPLESTWTLYAHTTVHTEKGYGCSYEKVCDVSTCEEWGSMWSSVGEPITGRRGVQVCIKGRKFPSWSFFRDGILPEWEHPKNQNGHTLCHRSDCVREAWKDLVADCARGASPPEVNGVQVTQKIGRNTIYMKLEVWLGEGADVTETVSQWLCPFGCFEEVRRK